MIQLLLSDFLFSVDIFITRIRAKSKKNWKKTSFLIKYIIEMKNIINININNTPVVGRPATTGTRSEGLTLLCK